MTRSRLKQKTQQVTIHKAWSKFKDHCPSFWMLPTGYTHNGNAIYETNEALVTDTPVVVLERRRYVGQDLTTYQIAVLDEDRVRLHEIPAVILVNPREAIKLVNYGIQVDGHSTHRLVKYLTTFIRQNQPPTVNLVTQIGQYRDGGFWGYFLYEPRGPMPDVKFDPTTEDLKALHAAMKPKGSLDNWCAVLKLASQSPKVMVTMLSSLYPLVRAALNLSAPNFTLWLDAPSSTGKTTACQMAVSMFADPCCREWLPEARGTYMGIEELCLRVQGLAVFLQDGHAIPQQIRLDVIYSIGEGQWKARAKSHKKIQRTWDGVAIVSGEGPPVLEADPSGAAARVIVLEGSPFGQTNEAMAHVIERELRPKIRDNYGHAAITFLDHLIELSLNNPQAKMERFRHLLSEYTSKAGGRRILQRQAEIWACLHLVAEIFAEVFSLSDEQSPVKAVETVFTECLAQEEHDRPQRAYEYVMDCVVSDRARFYIRTHGGTKAPVVHAPALGLIDETDNTVAFFRHALRDLLFKGRLQSFEELVAAWKEKGRLISDPPHRTYPVDIEGKKVRMVKLRVLKDEG